MVPIYPKYVYWCISKVKKKKWTIITKYVSSLKSENEMTAKITISRPFEIGSKSL